jgi:DNA helicase HerA-like ATPase
MDAGKDIDAVLNNGEIVGTVSSPSSNLELSIDIFEDAITKKLIGELVVFRYLQDGMQHYSIAQVIEIELKNVLLEDPTIKSIARKRGSVNAISNIQDIYIGKILCGSVFGQSNENNSFEQSLLGAVPPTGTTVYRVEDSLLNLLLKEQRENLFYLGHSYGSKTKLPMWFKHFGHGVNGAGEAYHLGIFGITGSGKSTLAKMIMTSYAKHPEMGMLVLDPVDEFAKALSVSEEDRIRNPRYSPSAYSSSHSSSTQQNNGEFNLNMKQVFQSLNKKFHVINVRNIVLDRWALFSEIFLGSKFFQRLTIGSQNKSLAVEAIQSKLREKDKITLSRLIERSTFDKVMEHLSSDEIQRQIFASEEPRKRLKKILEEIDRDDLYGNIWKPFCILFDGKRENAIKVDTLVEKLRDEKSVVVVDLSMPQDSRTANLSYWSENVQFLILKRILDGLIDLGEENWHGNSFLNTLVILDEAHRFANREKTDNQKLEDLRMKLLDAVRTTRKYGLGWMFLSTSLSSIHRDIIQQLRIVFYGFGLSLGSDLITLKEMVSDPKSIQLY